MESNWYDEKSLASRLIEDMTFGVISEPTEKRGVEVFD
jgi:hypothetical protein